MANVKVWDVTDQTSHDISDWNDVSQQNGQWHTEHKKIRLQKIRYLSISQSIHCINDPSL